MTSSRVAYLNPGSDELEAWDFDGTDWTLTGNPFTFNTASYPALAALSSTRVATINITTGDLAAYDFDGSDWTIEGSALTISGVSGACSMVAIDSDRIVMFDEGNNELRCYAFDGSTWTLKSSLAITAVASSVTVGITALSSNIIVVASPSDDTLQTYYVDDNQIIAIGNTESVSTLNPTLTSLVYSTALGS